ncbi:DUF5719 family protein [Herbiconiux sp. CPCC 203407]|uniref:DUF5719 family protein n=1 Tax=Herbiconiux oxytropis TaxID=2970915 RepID=A0AA41XCD1_9MICO|nr:DUF5719 family protein [Herbiconiux oxytropis]MCS5722059.1 DUF5719 family protein [Herbiconiux oxytropis]MCS5725641.1 DUF5719 family protein [Herbiconiux oxytropis]
MPADRTIVAKGTRVAVGIVAAAALVAAAGAAVVLPLPGVSAVPASFSIDPAPAEEVRACAGPLVRLSDDTGADATSISSVGTTTVYAAASDPAAVLDETALLSPDDVISNEPTAPARIALPAAAADTADSDLLFAAAQSQSVSTPELVGLAATSCGEASPDSWLVAGSTTVGRTSFVVLANPGDVNSIVDLAIYGDAGLVESPGAQNIDVPARSTRILSLAGLAPDLADPVIHVVASVGAVTAALQHSVVRGLEPGGVELAGATAPPAPEQTVTGVRVAGTSTISERLADADYSDLQSVLRLFVPGSEPASVTIRVTEERDGGAQTEYQVGLTPGVVTEFPLQDIPDGVYTVEAGSDVPFVMGARTSTVGNGGLDFAWYQSLQPLEERFFVTNADGPNSRLHIVSTTGESVEVTLTDASGVVTEATIVPGGRYLPLRVGGSYTVTTSDPVLANVTYFGDGRSSSFPIAPPNPAASAVVVYP